MAKKKQKEQNEAYMEKYEAYMENYRTLSQRLQMLSRFNVREFMGSRKEGDPRVNYLAGLESFKNLAQTQLSGIIRFLNESKEDKKPDLFAIMADELVAHLKSMEEDIGVVGWTDTGEPQFDLQVLREKTRDWPRGLIEREEG